MTPAKPKCVLFANTDWYLYNFRRPLVDALCRDGWDVLLVSPFGEYAERLSGMGYQWVPLEFSPGSVSPFHDLGVLRKLVRLYQQERPDLVHHFTSKCVVYGSIAARLAGGIPVVNAITGLGYVFTGHGIRARMLRFLVSRMYRVALSNIRGRAVFQNEADRDSFVRMGMLSENLTQVIRGSGVDCQRFRPGQPSKMPDRNGVVRILFASRLLKDKGVLEFLEAARDISARRANVEFVLAGDVYPDNPSSISRGELDRIRRLKGVSYLGHVDDMPPVLRSADIVVLPTYAEGTPKILLEAAATARPIVATDIAGNRGVVQHGVNGFLVPQRDGGSLVRAIERLIDEPQLRQTFGENGRTIALEQFEEKIVVSRTLQVYYELLDQEITPSGVMLTRRDR